MTKFLIALIAFTTVLPSFALPTSCSSLFQEAPSLSSTRVHWLSPSSLKQFDSESYQSALQTDVTQLPLQDLTSFEVKLAIMDRHFPQKEQWMPQIPALGLLRAHKLVRLFNDYTLEKLQDRSLRRQFLTKLFLLTEQPIETLKNQLRSKNQVDFQFRSERYYAYVLAHYGLEKTLIGIFGNTPSILQSARNKLNYILRSGWVSIPFRLPVLDYALTLNRNEENFWKGAGLPENQRRHAMNHRLRVNVYNQVAAIYGDVAMVVFTGLLMTLIPDLDDEIDKLLEHNTAPDESSSSPETEQRYEDLNKRLERIESELRHSVIPSSSQ